MAGFSDLMQQAQEMQGRMAEFQEQLGKMEMKGEAGAGLVRVTLNGKAEMIGLKIDESLLKPGEGEILEDLVVAAFGDAKAKVEAAMQDKMKELTGGMPLPPGFKPF